MATPMNIRGGGDLVVIKISSLAMEFDFSKKIAIK